MSERDRLFLVEIMESAAAIERHVSGMDEADYLSDGKTQDAVAMRIMQIG
jgi:uncharacterized protein with HEPN domain